MAKKHFDMLRCLRLGRKKCRRKTIGCLEKAETVRPLTECCECRKVKVCRVSGDRGVCGRMANMGVLPGEVMELLCSSRGRRRRQCMVRINGGTLSLDELTAASIFVEPA